MTAALVLVRHGQTDWNAEGRLQGSTDIPLNEVGRAQTLDAAAMLANDAWDLLVASPLQRAKETAAVIGEQLGLPTTLVVDDLRERDYGSAEGRLLVDLTPEELAGVNGVGGRLTGAEPEDAVAERGIQALRALVQAHPDRRIIVVAHGTLIRLTLSALLGEPHPRVENGQGIRLDPQLLSALDSQLH